MEMQKNVCNIVWIDDEIDTLLTDSKKRVLKKNGFELIGIARTFKDFDHIMNVCYDRVDAVITDANFNIDSASVKSERDLSGFVKVRESVLKYNQKRDIPFYLFTGRREVLLEKCEDGELDYFENNNRYFTKGEFSEMLEQIRFDVEHINSPSYRIRKKYAEELEAAALIEGNYGCLMDALLYDYSDEWSKTEDYFNPIRKIAESIFDECKRLSIIPPINELNAISKFLNNGVYENYSFIEGKELMPKPLARSLWYFLDITQDGSHKKGDLKLGVDKYVRDTKNINLFRTVLYIAMDLCLWYERVRGEADNPAFVPKWKRIRNKDMDSESKSVCLSEEKLSENEDIAQVKSYYETKTFKPEKDEDGCWHCEECLVGIHAWKDDGSIILYDLTNNTSGSKDKYPYYAKYKKV